MWICKYSIQPSAYLLKCQWGKSDFELEMFFLGGVISTSNAMGFPSKLWFSRTSSFLTTLWLSSPCWNAVLLLGDYSEKKKPNRPCAKHCTVSFQKGERPQKAKKASQLLPIFLPFLCILYFFCNPPMEWCFFVWEIRTLMKHFQKKNDRKVALYLT